jgi:hypothetical protein
MLFPEALPPKIGEEFSNNDPDLLRMDLFYSLLIGVGVPNNPLVLGVGFPNSPPVLTEIFGTNLG